MPGRVVVQWDKEDCEDLGIIKVDLLGLGMMSVMQDALALTRLRGHPVELAQIPIDPSRVVAGPKPHEYFIRVPVIDATDKFHRLCATFVNVGNPQNAARCPGPESLPIKALERSINPINSVTFAGVATFFSSHCNHQLRWSTSQAI